MRHEARSRVANPRGDAQTGARALHPKQRRSAGGRILAVGLTFAALIVAQPAIALNGHWQPPGVEPAAVALATVLAKVDGYRGSVSAPYREQLRLVAAGRTFSADAVARGSDIRYRTIIDGQS